MVRTPQHVGFFMSAFHLYGRYDGPIPFWEVPDCRAPLRLRRLRFHRRLALDAARSVLLELRRAGAASAAARLRHWHNALRLLRRYDGERRCHRALLPL